MHRDFKPGNVLVSAADSRARLMDFGLARMDFGLARMHADAVQTPDASPSSDANIELSHPLNQSLTITGSVVGTPAYMAPEIYDGRLADARSDQFAFGVTLYEALYGTRAEAKRTLDDLIVLETANQSPVLPTTLATRAEIALGESKWADALGFADRAIASLEASGGRDSADLWRPLAARGRALVALNQPKEAKVAITRAVEIGIKAKVKPADLGPARAALSAL